MWKEFLPILLEAKTPERASFSLFKKKIFDYSLLFLFRVFPHPGEFKIFGFSLFKSIS